jgi:uncharacterized DUF497 family protein
MRFAWNERKAASNLLKHGISFEEAATVFGDLLSDTFPDYNHSVEEQRFIIKERPSQVKFLWLPIQTMES